MSTTTIRVPTELKQKATRAAKSAGVSLHGFIVEAIAEKAALAEKRSEFLDQAEARFAQISASGQTIPWAQMQRYLNAKADGKKPKPPTAKKLAR